MNPKLKYLAFAVLGLLAQRAWLLYQGQQAQASFKALKEPSYAHYQALCRHNQDFSEKLSQKRPASDWFSALRSELESLPMTQVLKAQLAAPQQAAWIHLQLPLNLLQKLFEILSNTACSLTFFQAEALENRNLLIRMQLAQMEHLLSSPEPKNLTILEEAVDSEPMNTYIADLTDATFDAAVQSGVVLVDFWAPWCGPCRTIAPVLAELAEEMQGKVSFAKVSVDDNPNTPARFGIVSIPTLIVFKNGEEVNRSIGLSSKAALSKLLNAVVDK